MIQKTLAGLASLFLLFILRFLFFFTILLFKIIFAFLFFFLIIAYRKINFKNILNIFNFHKSVD